VSESGNERREGKGKGRRGEGEREEETGEIGKGERKRRQGGRDGREYSVNSRYSKV
jgi:hypothetical protein